MGFGNFFSGLLQGANNFFNNGIGKTILDIGSSIIPGGSIIKTALTGGLGLANHFVNDYVPPSRRINDDASEKNNFGAGVTNDRRAEPSVTEKFARVVAPGVSAAIKKLGFGPEVARSILLEFAADPSFNPVPASQLGNPLNK